MRQSDNSMRIFIFHFEMHFEKVFLIVEKWFPFTLLEIMYSMLKFSTRIARQFY